jgi:ketose-bisphosphate aldolase
MPLQSLKKMLANALDGGYAVGYFEPWDQYSMEAVIQAAEVMSSPVIIGCGGIMMNQSWFNGGGMELLAGIGLVLGEKSKVQTALLLNEVTTFEQILRGLDLGFNAVMLHTAGLSYEENLRITRRIVEAAHAVDVAVEAELGELPLGIGGGNQSHAALTDPDQAADFMERTGADALAVSIGNVHIKLDGAVGALDLKRLERIHRKVSVPLVIHGSTGFPDDAIPEAISLGVAKFNVGTLLKKAFYTGLREAISTTPEDASPHDTVGSRKVDDVLSRACNRVREAVERLIKLYLNRKA